MEFVVIAHDYKDEKALERRLAVREKHLKCAEKMFTEGKWLFASAMLNEKGNMNGSVIFCDFESEEQLKEDWLENEAYVKGNVWEEIIIRRAKVAKHKS